MASSSSPGWYKIAMAVAMYVTIYMVLIGENYLIRMIEVEAGMNENFFSEPVSKKSDERGSRWFTAAFVDTKIMAHTFDPFLPTEEERAKAVGMEDFARPLFHWVEGRIRAFWTMVWSSFTRLSSTLLWAPYVPLMIVPWVIDGWVQRERRKHTFEFSSPVKHRYALMGLAAMPLVFFAMLTSPVAMHPLVTPTVIFGLGILMHQGVANFMKRA